MCTYLTQKKKRKEIETKNIKIPFVTIKVIKDKSIY